MTTRRLLSALLLVALLPAALASVARADAAPAATVPAADTPAPPEDIRDIRPPYSVPGPRPSPPWLALGAGAAVLAGVAALYLRLRRARPLGLAEATLARLEAAREHVAAGDAYAFSVRVSEIVRDYLERRFALRASSQTTPEFLRDLADRRIPELSGSEAALDDFLDACDAAKYARYELGRPRMEHMADEARRLVESTRTRPRSENATKGDAA